MVSAIGLGGSHGQVNGVGGGLDARAGIIAPVDMPEISRFFGIVIAIYYKEHGVPHFHAKYAGQTGVFSIVELKLIEGRLPKRVVALVLEWAFEHRSELLENWQRAVAQEPLQPIAPLE